MCMFKTNRYYYTIEEVPILPKYAYRIAVYREPIVPLFSAIIVQMVPEMK